MDSKTSETSDTSLAGTRTQLYSPAASGRYNRMPSALEVRVYVYMSYAAFMYMYVYVMRRRIHVSMRIFVCIYIPMMRRSRYVCMLHTYIHTYIHTYVYIHTYIHTYVYTYIHMLRTLAPSSSRLPHLDATAGIHVSSSAFDIYT